MVRKLLCASVVAFFLLGGTSAARAQDDGGDLGGDMGSYSDPTYDIGSGDPSSDSVLPSSDAGQFSDPNSFASADPSQGATPDAVSPTDVGAGTANPDTSVLGSDPSAGQGQDPSADQTRGLDLAGQTDPSAGQTDPSDPSTPAAQDPTAGNPDATAPSNDTNDPSVAAQDANATLPAPSGTDPSASNPDSTQGGQQTDGQQGSQTQGQGQQNQQVAWMSASEFARACYLSCQLLTGPLVNSPTVPTLPTIEDSAPDFVSRRKNTG